MMEGTRARGRGHEGAKTYIRKCVAVFIHSVFYSVFDSRHSEINSKVKGPSIASGMDVSSRDAEGRHEGGRHEGRGPRARGRGHEGGGRRSVYKKARSHILGL